MFTAQDDKMCNVHSKFNCSFYFIINKTNSISSMCYIHS